VRLTRSFAQKHGVMCGNAKRMRSAFSRPTEYEPAPAQRRTTSGMTTTEPPRPTAAVKEAGSSATCALDARSCPEVCSDLGPSGS
jgi:hypothetical protein